MTSNIENVAGWIREASFVTALTGAGISTESGIPDFRGPSGVWTKNPGAERLATLEHYLTEPGVRIQAWRSRVDSPAWLAEPNQGHHALVTLEHAGKLGALVTQNVDGLHQRAGSDPSIVIEVHGTMHEVVCMSCEERAPMHRALDRVRAGEEDPECRTCGGILKSATISFGQALVPSVLQKAEAAATASDVFLAIGTSLQVYPVAYLPEIAFQAGAKIVIVNNEPTPFDGFAHAVFHEPIGDVLPRLAELSRD